jgi:hypothetical protein
MNAQKGTAQTGRRPPALHDRAIGLDERSLAQLIVSTARHAAGLAFVDAHGVHQGDWGELLARDESVLLARLACTDLDAAERDFLAAFEAQSLSVLADRLLRLWRKLDTPLQGLLTLDAQQGGPLPQQLRAAQAQLRDELGGLHAALQAAGLLLPVADLHAGWRFDAPPEASTLPLSVQLRQAFFSLRHVLEGLQRQAVAALPASLRSGRHEAAAGLLLAALQLFQRWQQEANGLHGRRIDFYYQLLLAQQPRPAARERVHLVLQRDAAEPLELPPGLDFRAGADAQGQAIRLSSEEPLCLGDAEVAALYTLRLLRDTRISPECSFDFVSGASAQQLPLQGGGRAWPLLGANERGQIGRDGTGAQPARLGLALASPLLKLQEGRRQIRLGLRLRLPETGLTPLCERALQAGRDGFARAMGRVFALWLLGEQDFAPGQLEALQQRAEELGLQPEARSLRTAGDPLSLFGGEPRPQRALMRDQLLRGLFQIELSAADGWLQLPAPNLQIAEPGLLQLLLQLPPSAPAIVGCDAELHGAQWPAGEAVLRLQIAPRVRIYPLSLLEGVRLQAIDLAVEVKDLRQLQLANQLGRLDAGKPCMPFGPLPDGASHLIVGAEELANKPVDALRLNLQWAGLPSEPGGFALHYADYEKGWRNDSFRVSAAVLRDGAWGESRDEGRDAATLPLFAADADERLLPTQRLILPPRLLQQRWRPVPNLGAGYDTGSRGGYLRLRLREPEDSYFGHALYPQLLTEVLSDNAKPRWRGGGAGQPLPTPPYTPLLERLTLDYRASRRISLGQAELGAERLWYQRPFGLEPLLGRSQLPTLLPEPGADGHLLIGLRARALGGPLSLLFELDDSMAEEARVRALPDPGLHWSVWDEGRWQALPASALLRDGTAGLLTSGVLVLDLPMLDASQDGDGSSMPQGLFWLRVASDAPSARFAGLRGVRAQAVQARLERPAPQPLRPGQLDGARAAVDGLRQVLQPLASTGHAPAEDVAAFRTRVAERLRHRQRACQPWDYERLVLAECPEVERALCLPGRGVVRVVLVPRVPRNVASLATQAFSLPVVVLERIEALLRPLASPFARIAVHSAGFERVQLRCHLHLRPGSVAGQLLQRAQAAVQQFLSPWFDDGLGPEFGWTLRGEDLEALLRGLPGVRAVSGLSLLHYGRRRDGRHWLFDSARLPSNGSSSSALLRPQDAGSLLLPADTQLIACSGETTAAVEHSGISHLGVGRNFIVGSA